MSDWAYAAMILLPLAFMALPAVFVLLLAGHLDGFLRIRWGMLLTALMASGLTIAIYGQAAPAWAQQQQAEDIRRIQRELEQTRADVRDNTKDIGFIEKTMENGQRTDASERGAIRLEIKDHEARLREVEQAVNRGYTLFAILAFVAPALFQCGLWAIQVLRRNGHGKGHVGS